MIGFLNLLYHTTALRGLVAIGIFGFGTNVSNQLYGDDEENQKKFAGAMGLSAFLGYSTWDPRLVNGLYNFTDSVADILYVKAAANSVFSYAIRPFFASTLPAMVQKGVNALIDGVKGKIHTVYHNPRVAIYPLFNMAVTSYFFTPFNEYRSAINILAKNRKLTTNSDKINNFENRNSYFDGFNISDPLGAAYIASKDMARLLNGFSNGFMFELPIDITLFGKTIKKGTPLSLTKQVSLSKAMVLLIMPSMLPYSSQIGTFATAYLFKPAMIIGLGLAVSSYLANYMLKSYVTDDIKKLKTDTRNLAIALNQEIKFNNSNRDALENVNIIKSVLIDYSLLGDIKTNQALKDAIYIALNESGLKDDMISRYLGAEFIEDNLIYKNKEKASITAVVDELRGETETITSKDLDEWLAQENAEVSDNTKQYMLRVKAFMEQNKSASIDLSKLNIDNAAKNAVSKETAEYLSDMKLFKTSSIYQEVIAKVEQILNGPAQHR